MIELAVKDGRMFFVQWHTVKRISGGEHHVNNRHRPLEMPPELAGHLVTLFEQYFGVTLRTIKDPQAGKKYVDIGEVCEILGLDVEEERARLLADPVLGKSLVIVEPDSAPQLD
jgi:hypothetical protein